MSSLTTPKPLAIHLKNVFKVYKLHGSQGNQLIDVLGLQRFGFKTKTPSKTFSALSDISLDVPRGHRIGIIGRNGAGKTTLLKLICGNFAPTSGEVAVNGTVQALMNIGLGFHPEYTGRENVEASLQYNGLTRNEYHKAMEDIITFCELGDFLDQPFKTYSLGMQARLMFAAATAIKPDILIIDDVLGAGDAYFIAKSKARIEKLVSSGCTMLLVSHSMQQVLELCDEAIWLDQGRIRMQREAFLVVKAYEEYLHTPIAQISSSSLVTPPLLSEESISQSTTVVQNSENTTRFHFEAPGGISRWQSEEGVKVIGFSLLTEYGVTNNIIAMQPVKFIITIIAERDDVFHCRYGLAINDYLGVCVARIFSPGDHFEIKYGQTRKIEMLLNPCQIGPGEYTVGISVLEYEALEKLNNTRRYDLLSRSFVIRIALPDSIGSLAASFFHTAEWQFT